MRSAKQAAAPSASLAPIRQRFSVPFERDVTFTRDAAAAP
jgi:hypothetical protein